MEKLSNIDNSRNSVRFGQSLDEKGLSYADVYYRLNGAGITEFNDILTKSGALIQGEGGKYRGSRSYYASDSGLRSDDETQLDCTVGNIQEKLFCLDNIDFKSNPRATNKNSKSDSDITTKELDLIHIPTGEQVEFKVSYSKLYKDKNAYYRHRGADFEDFVMKGNIMIIYFINLDKFAVVSKKYFNKSVKIKIHREFSKNKYWDVVTVWEGLMGDYKMMRQGNSDISRKVSNLVKYGK